jgi:hypothetical protein
MTHAPGLEALRAALGAGPSQLDANERADRVLACIIRNLSRHFYAPGAPLDAIARHADAIAEELAKVAERYAAAASIQANARALPAERRGRPRDWAERDMEVGVLEVLGSYGDAFSAETPGRAVLEVAALIRGLSVGEKRNSVRRAKGRLALLERLRRI